MTDEEGREFERHPHHAAAVRLRRYDDIGKVTAMKTPRIEEFRTLLESFGTTSGLSWYNTKILACANGDRRDQSCPTARALLKGMEDAARDLWKLAKTASPRSAPPPIPKKPAP